jgi:hypothetical protein
MLWELKTISNKFLKPMRNQGFLVQAKSVPARLRKTVVRKIKKDNWLTNGRNLIRDNQIQWKGYF